ncbi:MAG TPA: hypothetical protein VEK08_14390 [Planctomycetota bacterium]|nr:hypothetical protein [Planctomycetota bacterium]
MSVESTPEPEVSPAPPASAVAGTVAKPAPGKVPRKWNPPPPKQLSTGMMVLIIAGAVVLVGIVAVLAMQIGAPEPEAMVPKLAAEFTDPINSYSIRPPVGWVIEDRHDKSNIFIKGPKEPGLSPFIVSSLDIAPGSLSSYLQLHKGRIEAEEKTVQWISEDTGESIDGCVNTARLEYECDFEMSPGSGKFRIRALQYIMEDKPRFYRVTCFVTASLYEKYLPKFEACARSFRRQPLPRVNAGGFK